jgi:hypothetical protein
VRERDAERGRRRRDPVRDRQRGERAGDREADDGDLRPVDELLDEGEPAARGPARGVDRSGEPGAVGDVREALLPLPVRGLDDDGPVDLGRPVLAPDDPRARLRDARLGETLALTELVRREHGRLR